MELTISQFLVNENGITQIYSVENSQLKVLIFIICILAINPFSPFVCLLRVRTSEKYVLFRRPG
jgi:hypothetical protein